VLPEKAPVFIRFFARFKKIPFTLPAGAGEDLAPSLRGLADIA